MFEKVCECFQAAIYCAETCRCVSCENYEGSDAHEEVKRVYGSGARFHEHASAAASPSPSRRKLLAQRAARDSIDGASNRGGGGGGGGGLARARAPPLMHNLVQQGAVEELARILLVVADETSKCAVSSETKGEEKVKEEEKPAPTSTRRSSGGVAELAAEAAREIARDVAHVDELMCDEDIDARKARAAHARARDDVSIALDSTLTKYPEIEAALLGELERVARRIAENARARATEAKKRRLANTAAKSSAVAREKALELIDKAKSTKRLDLSGLGLRALPVEALELTELLELQVSNNNLYDLPSEMFERCTKIERLGLAGNRLRRLPKSVGNLKSLRGEIGACESLRNLVLGGNYLAELPEEIEKLKNLEELSAPGNRLRAIPDLGSMPLLREIDLHGNFIERLPEDMSGLRALETLSLQGNRVREVPKSLTKLRRLRALNLAENAMTTLPDEIADMTMLTSVWLYSNALTSLPGTSVRKMPSIRQIWIEGNDGLSGESLDAFVAAVDGSKTLKTLGVDSRQAGKMRTRGAAIVATAEIPENNPRGYFKLVRWPKGDGSTRAPVLVVSFGSAPGVPNWGGLLKKLQKNVRDGDSYDVLYVCDVDRSWYASSDASGDQELEFERWSAPLREACEKYERVLYVGDSMGASAALMFAEHATKVLAFCPQVDLYDASIRPSRSNVWFKRFKGVMMSGLNQSAADIDVHTGSWDHDKDQAALLPRDKVKHIVHQVDSHRLALALDGEEKLLPIIKSAFESELTAARGGGSAEESSSSSSSSSASLNAFAPWQSLGLK
ncbi:hypothetical protein BE221DRAFT_147452 [Ostreococcus tauri]|uniref:CRC domain-containing protein n=1 Tax=Ostreococcus tauri TaxID=70448 RepID=A0A1Y5I2E9_OSTTA|nr:hypothetical protein BE221DRAFT_147452 [Ostreococcus tauri]